MLMNVNHDGDEDDDDDDDAGGHAAPAARLRAPLRANL